MAYKDQNIAEVDTETKIPKVFISYNHKDQVVALKIKERLEKAGIEVIIDIEAMATGQNIAEFIKKCIQESGITLSLISANSLMSAWVAMETIWSRYDVTLRGRYFMPCNIDDYSFLDLSFVSKAHEFLKEEIKKIDNEIIHRRQNGIGIEDIQDDLTRLSRLISELPSIVGELKKSFCVNLNDENFEHGILKVIGDIKKALIINTLTEPVETKAKLPTERHGKKQPQKTEQQGKLDVADEIKRGNILYKIADTMQLNITERCEIRIAKNTIPLIELSDGLEVDGVIIKENVKVSDDMEVKLIPSRNNAFKIVNITNQEQLLDDDSFTQWIFDVTPLITGNQLLTLVVSIITRNIHKKEIKKDVVFERIINVVTSEGELKRSNIDHKEQIKQLILKGNLASAISELLEYTEINGQTDLHDLLIGQSARFNTNENDNFAGLLSPQDYQLTRNKITVAITSILNRYRQNPNSSVNFTETKPSVDPNFVHSSSNSKKRGCVLYFAIGSILLIIIIALNIYILPIHPKPETHKAEPSKDKSKIVEPQIVNIKLIVSSKYSNAHIFVDGLPAQLVENTMSVKTIRVELNKNHVFKLVSDNDSCETEAIFVTTDNQKITSCD
ncbi:MAG: TIR domain-containing protein [Mariniphaga sp.]